MHTVYSGLWNTNIQTKTVFSKSITKQKRKISSSLSKNYWKGFKVCLFIFISEILKHTRLCYTTTKAQYKYAYKYVQVIFIYKVLKVFSKNKRENTKLRQTNKT